MTLRERKQTNNIRLKAAHNKHQAWLESMGVSSTQLKQRKKLYKKHNISVTEFPDLSTNSNIRTSDCVPNLGASKTKHKYTGDEIMGIGLLHKSNYTPIRKDDKQGAKDLANMRRTQ